LNRTGFIREGVSMSRDGIPTVDGERKMDRLINICRRSVMDDSSGASRFCEDVSINDATRPLIIGCSSGRCPRQKPLTLG
jgi:hypothetical protein